MPDASRYHRLRLVLAAAGLAPSIAYLVALLGTGAAHALARAAAAAAGGAWGQGAVVAGGLGAGRAGLPPPPRGARGGGPAPRHGRLPPEEIESVLAHELGHHVHGDARRGLAVQGALMVAGFWLADLLLRAGAPALGLAGPADPAGMPWLALVLLALSLVALPLGNGFLRRIERQAHDFALAPTG